MKTTGTNYIRKLRGPQLGNRVSRVLVGIFYRKDDHSMLLGKLGELIKQQPEKVLPPHLPDIADDNCTCKEDDFEVFSAYLQLRVCAAEDVLRVSGTCRSANLVDWRTRLKSCAVCCRDFDAEMDNLRSRIWTVVKECSK